MSSVIHNPTSIFGMTKEFFGPKCIMILPEKADHT